MSACPKTDGYRGFFVVDSPGGFYCICQYDDGERPAVTTELTKFNDDNEGTGPMYGTTGVPPFITCYKWHPPTSVTPSPTPYEVVYKLIQSRSNTGLCIGLEGASTADNTRLHTYPCDVDDDSQKWGYNLNGGLQNLKDPTKCMTHDGLNNPVVLQPCAESYTNAQSFILNQRFIEIFAGYGDTLSDEFLVTPNDCTNGVTQTYLIMANAYADGSDCDTTQKWYWFNQTPPPNPFITTTAATVGEGP